MGYLVFLIFMGLVGALIGWLTNVLAIRLLFRPYQAYVLPLLHWELQGLIPKRHHDLATALAHVVSTELITGEDVALSLGREDNKEKLALKIQTHLKKRLVEKKPFIVPDLLQQVVANFAGNLVYQEVMEFLDNPQRVLSEEDLEDVKQEVRTIVEEKVLSFDLHHLERLIFSLAHQELKHIEVLGGILGFLIGIIQGGITLVLSGVLRP